MAVFFSLVGLNVPWTKRGEEMKEKKEKKRKENKIKSRIEKRKLRLEPPVLGELKLNC